MQSNLSAQLITGKGSPGFSHILKPTPASLPQTGRVT